jgi:hypothetical protein
MQHPCLRFSRIAIASRPPAMALAPRPERQSLGPQRRRLLPWGRDTLEDHVGRRGRLSSSGRATGVPTLRKAVMHSLEIAV